jgi:hypothetical protein
MKLPRAAFRGVVATGQILLFVALQLADGSGLHGCPEHDAIGPAAATVAPDHHAAAHHSEPADAHDHAAGCTCLGSCHGSAITGVPSVAPAIAPALTRAFAVGAPLPVTLFRVAPRLLPFQIGPPASA